jgi:4-aminobutyrate aminotransferase-like enzyme
VAAAAYAAVSTIIGEDLPVHAAEIGHYLAARCADLHTAHPVVTAYRVVGCMAAIDLAAPIAPDVKSYALEHGVIIQTVGMQMIRLLPALICEQAQVDRLIEVLEAGIHAAMQRLAQPSSAGSNLQ